MTSLSEETRKKLAELTDECHNCACCIRDAYNLGRSDQREQDAPALKYAGMCLECWRDGECADIDGCTLEEFALKSGLVRQVSVIEPCGELCGCADLGFPSECNKLTEAGSGAIRSAKEGL